MIPFFTQFSSRGNTLWSLHTDDGRFYGATREEASVSWLRQSPNFLQRSLASSPSPFPSSIAEASALFSSHDGSPSPSLLHSSFGFLDEWNKFIVYEGWGKDRVFRLTYAGRLMLSSLFPNSLVDCGSVVIASANAQIWWYDLSESVGVLGFVSPDSFEAFASPVSKADLRSLCATLFHLVSLGKQRADVPSVDIGNASLNLTYYADRVVWWFGGVGVESPHADALNALRMAVGLEPQALS